MQPKNKVFIATSLDGYIADKTGGIDWLHSIPNPEANDMGYELFNESIDAILMGKNTFETVCSFDMEWPYQKPVFVLSNSLKDIPEKYKNNVQLVNGTLSEVLARIHNQNCYRLYIDGGKTIQSFLQEDLIDEMIITIIPVLLGGGVKLFSELEKELPFECFKSELFLEKVVQNHFRRIR